MQVLILGAGYSGMAIARTMAPTATSVVGTTRTEEKATKLEKAGIRPILFDGETVSGELAAALGQATHLIQSIAPGRDGDPMFRTSSPDLAQLAPNLKWIGYLSTVGVSGDHGGDWQRLNALIEDERKLAQRVKSLLGEWEKLAE